MNPMAAMGCMQRGAPHGYAVPPPQPPTPEQMALVDKPSWEQIISLLRDNIHRSYRIDIETDSTVAGSIESDMAGLSQIMQAVSMFMKETMPLVQAGMLPVEAQKEMLMSITRRARMGMVVEDALDKIKAPQPQQDTALQVAQMKQQSDAQKAQLDDQLAKQSMQMQAQLDERAKQVDLQIEQQRLAMETQAEQQRQKNEMVVEQNKQAAQAQQIEHQNQLEAQRTQLESANEMRMKQLELAMEERMSARDRQIEVLIAQMNNAAKVEVAEIAAATTLQTGQESAANQAAEDTVFDME